MAIIDVSFADPMFLSHSTALKCRVLTAKMPYRTHQTPRYIYKEINIIIEVNDYLFFGSNKKASNIIYGSIITLSICNFPDVLDTRKEVAGFAEDSSGFQPLGQLPGGIRHKRL